MSTPEAVLAVIQKIPLEKIEPSPFQTRKDFNEEEMRGLAATLKEHGLLNPIIVRKKSVIPGGSKPGIHVDVNMDPPLTDAGDDVYELIAGERRVRAARLLGWTQIDARVTSVPDTEAAQQVVIENLQRDDLNPIEMAEGYKKLKEIGLTLEEIAKKVGVGDKSRISRFLSLLDFPQEVQDLLSRDNISEGHVRYLSRIRDSGLFLKVAKQAARQGWSVKETERRVNDLIEKTYLGTDGTRTDGARTDGARPQREGLEDPLADLWPMLAVSGTGGGEIRLWSVSYGTQHIQGAPIDGWRFVVANQGVEPREALRKWFFEMAKMLDRDSKTADGRTSDGKTADDTGAGWAPEKIQRVEDLVRQRKPSNLPRPSTDQFDPELVRLAQQSPKAIYSKLFGPDNKLTQLIGDQSWEDMGVSWQEALTALLDKKELAEFL